MGKSIRCHAKKNCRMSCKNCQQMLFILPLSAVQLGECIRYLLSHAGVDFVTKRIDDMGEWQREKYTLGLDFPNLPYYMEGDTKLTQTVAILRFLGRKHGMAPKTEEEQTR